MTKLAVYITRGTMASLRGNCILFVFSLSLLYLHIYSGAGVIPVGREEGKPGTD